MNGFWPSTFWYTLNLSWSSELTRFSFWPSIFWYTLNHVKAVHNVYNGFWPSTFWYTLNLQIAGISAGIRFWPSTFWYTLNLHHNHQLNLNRFWPSTFWYTLNTLTWVFTFAVSDFLLFDKYKHPLTALIGNEGVLLYLVVFSYLRCNLWWFCTNKGFLAPTALPWLFCLHLLSYTSLLLLPQTSQLVFCWLLVLLIDNLLFI